MYSTCQSNNYITAITGRILLHISDSFATTIFVLQEEIQVMSRQDRGSWLFQYEFRYIILKEFDLFRDVGQ